MAILIPGVGIVDESGDIRIAGVGVVDLPATSPPPETTAITPIPLHELGLLEKVNGYSMHIAWIVPAGSADTYVPVASIGTDGNDRLDLLVNLSAKTARLDRVDNDASTIAITTDTLAWSEGDVINIRASWGDATAAMILYADAETASSNAAEAQADAPEAMTMFVLNGTAETTPDDGPGGTYRGFKVWDYALSDAELAALSAEDFALPTNQSNILRPITRSVTRSLTRKLVNAN